jgi:signal transduction histidine kinase
MDMTLASFRFSPAILARLGEELNQSADQSILELIKNSYDANANKCTVELHNTAGSSYISIIDDGDGMDVAGIQNGWLVLGKSGKSNAVETRLGRKPAGSKGLGRLAALRMGKKIELSSVQISNLRRVHKLEIDWANFDTAALVEDVELEIITEKNSTRGKGVKVVLQDLRQPLRSDEVKKLARSVLLLTDPFGEAKNGFEVKLIAPEFKEIEDLLKKKYFDQADYHLHATLDEDGNGSAKILDWQGNPLAYADHAELRRKKKELPYKAPKTTFDLWVFLLTSTEFSARRVTKSEISSWLSTFGGVHIYQDEIRVSPYGNPGNDWLEMNLARARSPEERPGTHTSIGRIVIPGASPYEIRQKTDRTGFIEDDNFIELKTFANDAMNWLARWRLERAEERRRNEKEEAPKATRAHKEKLAAAIAKASPTVRATLEAAFVGYEKSRDKEAEALKKEVQLYRTLSTAGITAATFSHESQGNPIKIIDLCVNTLTKRIPQVIKVAADQKKFTEPVGKIREASGTLATLGNATLSLVRSSKRRMGRVEVHDVLTHTYNLMHKFIEGRDATLELTLAPGNPYLRSSHAALESIVTNLINNALRAFEHAGSDARVIHISTMVGVKEMQINVADSGPGIKDLKLSEIWLPGTTTNPDGTGLGLTIVKDTLRDIGGRIEAVENGILGGAEFIITLPILGK